MGKKEENYEVFMDTKISQWHINLSSSQMLKNVINGGNNVFFTPLN